MRKKTRSILKTNPILMKTKPIHKITKADYTREDYTNTRKYSTTSILKKTKTENEPKLNQWQKVYKVHTGFSVDGASPNEHLWFA